MKILTLVVLAFSLHTTSASSPPKASLSDPAGLVLGVKYPSRGEPILMVGVLNTWRAYERRVTPGQIAACTRQHSMTYPTCLRQVRVETHPS